MKQERGLTLLEVVLTSMIALVVGTFLVTILVNETGVLYNQNSIVSEGLSLNDAMAKINGSIKQAALVSVGYPESTPTYTTGPATLVLKLPATTQTGTLTNVYDYFIYTADSTNLKILRELVYPDPQSKRGQSNQVLSTVLDQITFSYLDNNGSQVTATSATRVGVNLSALAKTGSIGSARSSSSVTSLRNM